MSRPILLPSLGWFVSVVEENDNVPAFESLPNIPDLDTLFSLLGFSPQFPWHVIRNASMCYSKFWIDKDTKRTVPVFSPDLRLREINAPNKTLKVLQKRLIDLLKALPMHPANFAYMKGKSIRMCAAEHENQDVIIKVDIKDFFGSHTSALISRKIQEMTDWPKDVCWAISRMVTLNGRMPQGAVSSPFLSIVLNYSMDCRIAELAAQHGFTYTRYADDMAFGSRSKNNAQCWSFIKALKDAMHPYHINWDKVDVMRNSAYRYLCGVILDGNGDIDDSDLAGLFECEPLINRAPSRITVSRREPLSKNMYDNMVSELRGRGFTVSPKFYYVQDFQRMLGMNLTPTVHYPRNKYNDMRLQALLVTKKAPNINQQRFFGRLSFLRSIDPTKADKIDRILLKGEQHDTENQSSHVS